MVIKLPDQPVVDRVTASLGELIAACESHPAWTPPNPNKTLYFMWDFIHRSRRMLRTLPGNPTPETPNPPARTAAEKKAADEVWFDVMGRCVYTKTLMDDRGPKLTVITGGDPSSPFDFGEECRAKAAAVVDSFGDE